MSRLYVDRISPYQSGSVTVDGLSLDTGSLTTTASFNAYTSSNDSKVNSLISATGSYATTGSNTFTGAQTITTGGASITGSVKVSGYVEQNFAAPGTNEEKAFFNITGAQVNGNNYDRVFYGIADYPSFGTNYADYFAIEYYNGLGYNFGSEFNINGNQTQLLTIASGSGQSSYVRTTDNYDGTSQVSIGSGNKIAIVGKAELSNVLELAPQDPLPGGGTGQLAVSGSNLYFHNGSSWTQIN